jgi:hypothetical protein
MPADYFDRAGQPMPSSDARYVWELYRVLANDDVPGGFVSTVWTGTRPGLFRSTHYPSRRVQRYETEAEALAGHQQMVEEESK